MQGQIDIFLKSFIPALILTGLLGLGIWIKGVYDQKKRNAINEIDLSGKKIKLDLDSKPIDDVVSESNKGHGLEPPSGDDPKKG